LIDRATGIIAADIGENVDPAIGANRPINGSALR
jgi:hypothetical protein